MDESKQLVKDKEIESDVNLSHLNMPNWILNLNARLDRMNEKLNEINMRLSIIEKAVERTLYPFKPPPIPPYPNFYDDSIIHSKQINSHNQNTENIEHTESKSLSQSLIDKQLLPNEPSISWHNFLNLPQEKLEQIRDYYGNDFKAYENPKLDLKTNLLGFLGC